MNPTTTADTPEIEFESVGCPLCGNGDLQRFRSGQDLLHRTKGEFQLVRCKACRHVFLNPRPTRESIRHVYPSEYAPYHLAAGEAAPRSNSIKTKLRTIPGLQRCVHWLTDSRAEFIPAVESSPKRALEVGCADGGFLQRLQELGWDGQGVEISVAAAAAARGRGMNVESGTLEAAGFADSRFDAAFAWMVVEHLHDPVATLNEIRRVLVPSGWFVFSVPNLACWEPRVFRKYWHAYDLPRHLQHFTKATLRKLLAETGFELVHIFHHRTAYNVTGSLGLLFRETFPKWLGRRLLKFTDNPSIAGILLLNPLARLMALFRQSGMLTVVARKRTDSD